MDVREKLVELLNGIIDGGFKWHSYSYESGEQLNNDEIASHLIAHGVTVQEWISVRDRLPKYTEEEMERYRFFGDTFFPEFNVMIFGAIKPTTLYYDGERWYDEESRCYYVTHWQPMPQPPKGE